jgi:hypothetical protein
VIFLNYIISDLKKAFGRYINLEKSTLKRGNSRLSTHNSFFYKFSKKKQSISRVIGQYHLAVSACNVKENNVKDIIKKNYFFLVSGTSIFLTRFIGRSC